MQQTRSHAHNAARLLLAAAVVVASACSGGAAPTTACRVDADCASGTCRSDLTCAPVGETDAPGRDAGPHDGGSTGESGGGTNDGGSSGGGSSGDADAGSVGCLPNHDGRIDADEMTLRAGLFATFRIASGVPFDTKPVDGVWDLSKQFSGDHDARVELETVSDKWFGSDFPDATYAAQLSDGQDLLGIFKVTENELQLIGVASRADGVSSTKLTYSTPVTVLRFPIQLNATWSTTSNVSGTANGFPVFYSESYTSKVDKQGTVKTPFADFPVLRVNTQLERVTGLLVNHLRTHSFATECFGTIATVASDVNDDVTTSEFTTAGELRRLAP